ncbi:protein suppressor of white apricot [Melitaea cinxia]|uniref:protein suppressor of white apricot n=1 Tax=Melitaea cinxia TaxID=113334 RepID=UPI001E271516|nr:protein suppressor of white apricot [Melitaea cinxia]
MSVKWTGSQSETGILRKSEFKEKKEELFVFGYSCKLFRDDDKALHIDQGKHLIPWMGDETLKIDRYDARGALHDLSTLEAPSGGYDWRVELTRAELDVEQLCDEERYRALHTDEDEEEMYKEEELKRLHAAGYGQVGFNYDTPSESMADNQTIEIEEPFEPTPDFQALLPVNTVFPETQKQNAIIEKTAKFIANQGAQMEILIKAKQGDNVQFKFLNKDSPLHPYYTALIGLVKSGKWPEKKTEAIEEKQQEANEDYLHPSLASTVIESAPSIPSIHYKPSADCDYTLLISKMRGETTLEEPYSAELAPGEVAPPGTEPLPPRTNAEITKPPVMYNRNAQAPANSDLQQYTAYYNQYVSQVQPQPPPVQQHKKPTVTTTKSTGLSLMKNYNTDSDTDDSDFDDSSSSDSKHKPAIVIPPDDVKVVIDKMAAYVARNGDEFEDIVRSKNDPRFTFLEPNDIYHPFYKKLMQEKRGVDINGKDNQNQKHDKGKSPVSFSIKKHKEPDPILPRPALPYESSSEDEENGKEATEKPEETPKEVPKTNIPQVYSVNNMPPVVVYKMEAIQVNNLPLVKAIEPQTRIAQKPIIPVVTEPAIKEIQVKEQPVPIKVEEKPVIEKVMPKIEVKKEKTPEKREERVKDKEKRSPSRDKKKHRDRKKDYRSEHKSDYKDRRAEKNAEREKERERKREKESERQNERDRKRKKYRQEVETEIISLEDNSNEMIDLTGEQSDTKAEGSPPSSSSRRRRAAELLRAGLHPAAARLPATSLASAMVDTLESLRKKKSEEEEKRRRRDKRQRRDKRDYDDETDKYKKNKRKKNRSSDEEDSDYEGSKKKKRKKDKKHTSKSKKKRRREVEESEPATTLNIDLTNTLKELRTSPTKVLGLEDIKELPTRQESSEEGEKKKKKKEREYSEGEWSSDSGEDSLSSDKE